LILRMVNLKYILKVIFFSLCLLPLKISAQTGSKPLQIPDTSKTESKGSSHALYAGGGYGSNMIYLGSTISGISLMVTALFHMDSKVNFMQPFQQFIFQGLPPIWHFISDQLNYSHTLIIGLIFQQHLQIPDVVPSLTDTSFQQFYI